MIDPFQIGSSSSPLTRRWLGVPLLFAVAYSAVGFSLYFSLGLVAERGLGLTPLIFLGVGIVFLLNTLTYVEGEAMLPERGGSATFARHAFRNELVSFIAGWAILIDYVIVDRPRGDLGSALPDADLVGLHRHRRRDHHRGARRDRADGGAHDRRVHRAPAGSGCSGVVAIAGVALLVAVIVVGLITSWDPSARHRRTSTRSRARASTTSSTRG